MQRPLYKERPFCLRAFQWSESSCRGEKAAHDRRAKQKTPSRRLLAHGVCRATGEEARNYPHRLPLNPSRAFSPLPHDVGKALFGRGGDRQRGGGYAKMASNKRSNHKGTRSNSRGARSNYKRARSNNKVAGSNHRGARSNYKVTRSNDKVARSNCRGARSNNKGAMILNLTKKIDSM